MQNVLILGGTKGLGRSLVKEALKGGKMKTRISVILVVALVLTVLSCAVRRNTAPQPTSTAQQGTFTQKDLEKLRETVKDFIHAWHVKGDPRSALSFVSKDSPILLDGDKDATLYLFHELSVTNKATYWKPSPSDAKKTSCLNDVSVDGFCVFQAEELAEGHKDLQKNSGAEKHHMPPLEKLFFVGYFFNVGKSVWPGKILVTTV